MPITILRREASPGQESTISVLQISDALCCRVTSYRSSIAHCGHFPVSQQFLDRNTSSSERKIPFTDGFHTCVLAPPYLLPLSHKCCTEKKGGELISLSMNRWTIRDCWHLNGLFYLQITKELLHPGEGQVMQIVWELRNKHSLRSRAKKPFAKKLER